MALNPVAGILRVIRGVGRLFENVEKLQTGLERLDERVRVLEDRMAAPESGQRELVTGAHTAAAVAAGSVVTQHIADMSRRIGPLL